LVILCVEIGLHMIKNSNKLNIILMHLGETFNAIFVTEVREHNDYNINKWRISIKIFLCILVILCVEIRLQMKQNTNKL
jgi:hypothetical protein